MERRQRRNRREWEKLIGEQEHSGLSAQEFCQERSLGLASFYQWRQRIRSESTASADTPEVGNPFIHMGSLGSSGASNQSDPSSLVVSIELGGGLKLTVQRA